MSEPEALQKRRGLLLKLSKAADELNGKNVYVL